ncbi:hypothetical protein V8P74_24885, partial [Escherichia coli]|uniref:hypothetical protein n=1 Tax=Escherichia coli TaxID=562 RepID=UPI003D0261BD
VWGFKGSGNPCFDFEIIAQFLRKIQTAAEVPAGVAEIIKAQAGNDIRARNRFRVLITGSKLKAFRPPSLAGGFLCTKNPCKKLTGV